MRLALFAPVALVSCATAAPLAPDPNIDLRGEWRVIAVNGRRTPATSAYYLRYKPPAGSARFGCNAGSGSARVENGWLVTENWISTVAGCPTVDMRFEREGFEILGKPLAVERREGGAQLRNERGTIDLKRNLTAE